MSEQDRWGVPSEAPPAADTPPREDIDVDTDLAEQYERRTAGSPRQVEIEEIKRRQAEIDRRQKDVEPAD